MTGRALTGVGLGLYLHDLPPGVAADRLVAQAAIAEEVGFDGATISEHHAGFPGYLANPLLAASWVLEATGRIWSGPLPLLLPLRNAALVAEDVGWLAARFPHRVVAGFAPGYQREDFEAVGVEGFDRRGRVYTERLEAIAAALRQRAGGGLARDHALAAGSGSEVPLLGAAGSDVAARRAARAGAGLLLDSTASDDDLARMRRVYVESGGDGPVVLGRRLWLGRPPADLLEALLAGYRKRAEAGSWMQSVSSAVLISGSADAVLNRVVAAAAGG